MGTLPPHCIQLPPLSLAPSPFVTSCFPILSRHHDLPGSLSQRQLGASSWAAVGPHQHNHSLLCAPSSWSPGLWKAGYLHSWVLGPQPHQDCPRAPRRMQGPNHALLSFGKTTSLCQGGEANERSGAWQPPSAMRLLRTHRDTDMGC